MVPTSDANHLKGVLIPPDLLKAIEGRRCDARCPVCGNVQASSTWCGKCQHPLGVEDMIPHTVSGYCLVTGGGNTEGLHR